MVPALPSSFAIGPYHIHINARRTNGLWLWGPIDCPQCHLSHRLNPVFGGIVGDEELAEISVQLRDSYMDAM